MKVKVIDFDDNFADIIGNGHTYPVDITYVDLVDYINSAEGQEAG